MPVLLPAVVALGSGWWGIDRQNSMWRDESVTYQVAHRSLGDLWDLLGTIDAVHGLYYVLMHVVFAVWDGGLPALRLPSVLATSVAAAGVGAIGAGLAGRRAGAFAGLVFVALPVTQHYAQEGRSYALVSAAVVWATYFLLRGVTAGGGRAWAAYALTLGLACWLHEFAVLVLVAHGPTLWLVRVPSRVWRRWGIVSAVVLVTVLPLAVVSAGQADQQLGWLGRPGLAAWLRFLATSSAGVLLSRFLVRGAARMTVRGSDRGTLLACLALPMLVAPAGVLMTFSLVSPWYVERYVLYGMVGLALLAGAALDRLAGLRDGLAPVARMLIVLVSAVAVLLVLVPWSMLVRSPESRKDDVVAVAQAVGRVAGPDDGLLFMPARRREWLLSYPSVYGRLEDLALAESPAASGTLQGVELPAETIRQNILAHDRVVALTDPPGQPLDTVAEEAVKRRALASHFRPCERVRVRGARVIVYARAGNCGSGSEPPDASIGGGPDRTGPAYARAGGPAPWTISRHACSRVHPWRRSLMSAGG
ncbi:glycosyltransferase family 39 protein [Streptomyces sp. WG5]|uniref:glycosyltransferase family 39 protein n=1 Tax=Streptomyces sp. WG5 TaxID=3417648 RepID=UPI003CF3E54C